MSQTPVLPTPAPQAVSTPPQPLVITRTFSVPRDRVFKAWTTASQLARWFAPSDAYEVKAQLDLRVGGAYRIEMHHSGGTVNTVVGTYQDIVVPQRLSFTWNWEGSPAPETLVTVDFADHGAVTEVTMTHQRFVDVETRTKHGEGWNGCLTRLDRMFASHSDSEA